MIRVPLTRPPDVSLPAITSAGFAMRRACRGHRAHGCHERQAIWLGRIHASISRHAVKGNAALEFRCLTFVDVSVCSNPSIMRSIANRRATIR